MGTLIAFILASVISGVFIIPLLTARYGWGWAEVILLVYVISAFVAYEGIRDIINQIIGGKNGRLS